MCKLDDGSAVPELDDCLLLVRSGLIPDREIGLRDLEITLGIAAGELERIETDARHEMELLEQHITDGADLPSVTVVLPQHPSVGVSAPVTKGGKLQRNYGDMPEILRDELGRLVAAEPDANTTCVLLKPVAIGLPTIQGDDDVDSRRQIVLRTDVDESVVGQRPIADQPRHAAARGAGSP